MAFEATGIAAPAELIAVPPASTMFSNATRYTIGPAPTLVNSDELFWIAGDATAVVRSLNRSILVGLPTEEAEEGADAPSARGYEEYAAENLRLSEASLGAAFEVLPPE